MNAQSDLFGGGPPPPRKPMAVQPQPARPAAEPPFPVPPTLAWARRLAAAGAISAQVQWHVSWLWSGEVVESLSLGPDGRALLFRDGTVRDIKPDPGAFGRTVFLDPTRAIELHAKRPLVLIAPAGTHSARFRLAGRGEAAPADLELPPGCGYG